MDEPSQRIQTREMLRIANQYLKRNKKRPIKSKETVRAFGKPRNKRSLQAKQHRGKSLWSFTKSQKKECNRHINVHYNRACIKNYTRLTFSKKSKHRGRVLRIAIDDKCYLRCGTSEGFSRPLHNPAQLVQEELKHQLPSSDYPKRTGYVSPGVVLMVNEQIETEYNGQDKFVPANQRPTTHHMLQIGQMTCILPGCSLGTSMNFQVTSVKSIKSTSWTQQKLPPT